MNGSLVTLPASLATLTSSSEIFHAFSLVFAASSQ